MVPLPPALSLIVPADWLNVPETFIVPVPVPEAQLIVPPVCVKLAQVIVPLVFVPSLNSEVPVEAIVNVPVAVMVVPPMLGAVD